MTPSTLISTLASGARPNLDVDIARAVLALARSGVAATGLQTLHVGDFDVPVRLAAPVPALPDRIHSIETYKITGALAGVMLVLDNEIGIGLVAGDEALALNIARPVSSSR